MSKIRAARTIIPTEIFVIPSLVTVIFLHNYTGWAWLAFMPIVIVILGVLLLRFLISREISR